MTELEVFQKIQVALAESLGMEAREIWLPHKLRGSELNAVEHTDFLDIAWRLNRCFKSYDIEISVDELENNPHIEVSDILRIIKEKLSST